VAVQTETGHRLGRARAHRLAAAARSATGDDLAAAAHRRLAAALFAELDLPAPGPVPLATRS
jgi:hypothetical protein